MFRLRAKSKTKKLQRPSYQEPCMGPSLDKLPPEITQNIFDNLWPDLKQPFLYCYFLARMKRLVPKTVFNPEDPDGDRPEIAAQSTLESGVHTSTGLPVDGQAQLRDARSLMLTCRRFRNDVVDVIYNNVIMDFAYLRNGDMEMLATFSRKLSAFIRPMLRAINIPLPARSKASKKQYYQALGEMKGLREVTVSGIVLQSYIYEAAEPNSRSQWDSHHLRSLIDLIAIRPELTHFYYWKYYNGRTNQAQGRLLRTQRDNVVVDVTLIAKPLRWDLGPRHPDSRCDICNSCHDIMGELDLRGL